MAIAAVAFSVPSVAVGRADQSVTTDDVAHDGGLQWGFDRIRAAEAWAGGRGSGVVIAVVDSGVALEHEDLAGQLVPGTSCRSTAGDYRRCTGSPQDDDGHGTHVAGIAGAKAGNRTGIAGVAPDARIMPIKVLFHGQDCQEPISGQPCPATGNALDVAAAIRWAVAHGADIINLSLGSTSDEVFGPEFVDAVEEAWDAGVIAVVAAGNDFVETANFADAHAVVVGATTRSDGVPSYANGVGNARWAISAPGGDEGDTTETCAQGGNPIGILSTYWAPGDNGAYACLSGTSMAAPHVSAALALLLSMPRYSTARSAVERLVATAVDLGEPGRDDIFGSGRVDLAAAVGVSPTTTSTTSPSTTVTPTLPSTTLPPTTETSTSTTPPPPETTGSVPTTPPVTLDEATDEGAAPPLVLTDDDPDISGPLAVGAGALALAVALTAAALRRRDLV